MALDFDGHRSPGASWRTSYMPYVAALSTDVKQGHLARLHEETISAMTTCEGNKKYWSFGNILGQGGFGLIYLGIILPMYVLLKLVELGPCDVTFIIGSITVVYFVLSSMLSLWYTQISS